MKKDAVKHTVYLEDEQAEWINVESAKCLCSKSNFVIHLLKSYRDLLGSNAGLARDVKTTKSTMNLSIYPDKDLALWAREAAARSNTSTSEFVSSVIDFYREGDIVYPGKRENTTIRVRYSNGILDVYVGGLSPSLHVENCCERCGGVAVAVANAICAKAGLSWIVEVD